MGPIQTLDDLKDLLRRRVWLIAGIVVAGMVASVLFALSRGHVYESAAVIQIATPVVQDAEDGGAAPMSRQLQLIEQRIMARENMIALMEEYGLLADLDGLTMNQKVAALRESIALEVVGSAGPPQPGRDSVTAVIVNVRADLPDQAAAVANDIAATIMEETARGRQGRIDATLAFFSAEEERLAAELAAMEEELAAFRTEHEVTLPESLGPLRMELSRRRDDLLLLDRRMATLEREREALLARGQSVLTQRQLPQIEEELSSLAQERSLTAARVAEAEAVLLRAPEVERQLVSYQNRLELLRERYRDATSARAAAELDQRLATGSNSARVELLESAVPPDYPAGTSRRKLALAGGAASVGLALAVAFLLDLLNPVIRTPGQMQRALDLRPVVTIPYVQTPWERRRQQMMLLGGLVLLALVLLAAVAVTLG